MESSSHLPIEDLTRSGMPRCLAPWFQEYDLERLDPALHADLVLERVLAYGNRQELRWLFGIYDREQVTGWLQRLGARRLPWRRYNLWCVLFDLPPARREDNRIWPH